MARDTSKGPELVASALSHAASDLKAAYMTTADDHWFVPTAYSRGPWDPQSCHAGPPTAVLVRAMERCLAHAAGGVPADAHQLVRVTVDLRKPVPMAGFSAEATIQKAGRSVSWLGACLRDAEGKEIITASGLALRSSETQQYPNLPPTDPGFLRAEPGPFPLRPPGHDLPGFTTSTHLRYPPGQTTEPGPTMVWMKTVPLLAGEQPSPFQMVCPIADSGNAFSRNAEPADVSFVNPDLSIVLHRPPQGEWIGSASRSHWHANGIGLASATLYDVDGEVGVAQQTLLLAGRQ